MGSKGSDGLSAMEEVLFETLSCPVCLTYARPPIQMCVNSHITCNECFHRIDSCPTCRGAMSIGRVYILEKIFEKMEIPCKFDECPYKGKGEDAKAHEQVCEFFPIVCPLRSENGCTWNGTVHSLPDHLRNVHPENVFFDNSQTIRVRNFARNYKGLHFNLFFCVSGKVFLLYWAYEEDYVGAVRFTMSEIGNPNSQQPRQYQFALYFSRNLDVPENDCVHLSAGIARADVSTVQNKLHNGNYFTLGLSWLQDVCDLATGDLNYKVVIKKIEKPSENDTYCKIFKK